jgi:hypothetical protein
MQSVLQSITVNDVVALLWMLGTLLVAISPALLAIPGRGAGRWLAIAFNGVALIVLCLPHIGPVVTIACVHGWLIAVVCAFVALRSRRPKLAREAVGA